MLVLSLIVMTTNHHHHTLTWFLWLLRLLLGLGFAPVLVILHLGSLGLQDNLRVAGGQTETDGTQDLLRISNMTTLHYTAVHSALPCNKTLKSVISFSNQCPSLGET